MCSLPEFFVALCVALTLPVVLFSIHLQKVFNRELEAVHPSVWAEFGTKGYFKYDESPKEAAAGWFLLTGQYHYLGSSELNKKGDRARWVTLTGLSVMCLGFLATALPRYESVFACLPL